MNYLFSIYYIYNIYINKYIIIYTIIRSKKYFVYLKQKIKKIFNISFIYYNGYTY